jgi:4-hydroxybenzoate polyprenyltransferase
VAMAAARVGARRGTPMLVLETMRPRQWVKNVFVLGGLVFAGETLHADKVGIALVVFAAFCLASSAAYLVNDVVDMEADRHARRTASRPIARGHLAPRTALVAAAVAALVAVGITAAVSNWQTLLTLTGFVALQAAYSYKLKHVLIVDVMAIAAGFVLRAYAGLISIEVRFSVWLLLCTGLIALYLALGNGDAGKVVSITAAYPAVTLVLAAAYLSEAITPGRAIGTALIVGGVVIVTLAK